LRYGELDYLVLECLAERTIAVRMLEREQDPHRGYDPLLERRLAPLLPLLRSRRTRLISNLGAANPLAAAQVLRRLARRLEVEIDVAVVLGDDVLALVDPEAPAWEDGAPLREHGRIVAANAYIGAEPIVQALRTGADVVITGRVADPSMFLAALAHARGWDLADVALAAHGTLVGHLLECAGQVSGGYFADPPWSHVPRLAELGFPFAEVDEQAAVITKLPGSGGRIDLETVLEQLSYEILDPCAYVTPDVVADFTAVSVEQVGEDRVALRGATGSRRPDALKVAVGYDAGYLCEAEISYAGQGARARAELAADVVTTRLGGELEDVLVDLLGVDPLPDGRGGVLAGSGECRARLAARSPSRERAARLGEEVTALYTNGPAGGGGVRVHLTRQIGVASTSIARRRVRPSAVLAADLAAR
jgi:hypothetical protein